MENQLTTERTEELGSIPKTTTDVAPINYEAAMASFTEEEQKEIIALADSIDVTKIENVMNYGSVPLKATFEQCGKFLKDERGSQADQEVIAQVIELSKKASNSYDDFNLIIKEPNLFWKLILKLSNGGKSRTEKIQHAAITNYKLLAELKKSCDSWLEMLKKAMEEIYYAFENDTENIVLLEKYIIAGYIAQKRIELELNEIKSKHQETGLQKYAQDYEISKEGYDIFVRNMLNLEKSRVMYNLSLGQLTLMRHSNRDVQIAIHTQKDNSMALIGQQLRNAVLNAKTREVLEGQKAISRLSDELIKDVSRTVGLTAEEAEKLLYVGIYNVEAAKEAIVAVKNSYEVIQKTATEMLPKMKADTAQLNDLIKDLEPYVQSISKKEETLKIESTSPTGGTTGKLTF